MENLEKSQNKGGDEHGRRLRTPSGGIGMPGKWAGRAGDSGMRAHSDIPRRPMASAAFCRVLVDECGG